MRAPLLLLLQLPHHAGEALLSYEPVTSCAGRTCRPGEGNPRVTHDSNPYKFPPATTSFIKTAPTDPFQITPAAYEALVSMANRLARAHSRQYGQKLVIMCAADFDYREVALNWHVATKRANLSNALVYAMDRPAYDYFLAHGIPTVDGSTNLNAWNQTRIQRHIQRVDAEKHVAAAALASAGLDVLLTEASHVIIGDITPTLYAISKNHEVDMAVPRGICKGQGPVGCAPSFNLVFLHGAGPSEQRMRAAEFQVAGVRKGMIDFYLRWYNGAHCIVHGISKHFQSCDPKLVNGITAQSIQSMKTLAIVSMSCHENTRLGLLPDSFFNQERIYGETSTTKFGLIARSAKPVQRDRLNLNRYDEQDFNELVTAMKADKIWFL